MKKWLEDGTTIGGLIESLQRDGAYLSIAIKPSYNFSIYVSWWSDGEDGNYSLMIHDCDELLDGLVIVRQRVDEYLAGDKSNWELKEGDPA